MKESNVKNKTYLDNKIERSDQKANTNTSAEMKISDTIKRNSQTVNIENKTKRKGMSKTKHI